jgi:hypothetical protein
MKKNTLLLFVLVFIVVGCVIDSDITHISRRPELFSGPKYFSSCINEEVGDNEERHILSFCVEKNQATYTYTYRLKYLVSKDTITVYINDSTPKTYIKGNYRYENRDPYVEVLGIDMYKEDLIKIHTRYLDSSDTIVVYRGILSQRRMFEDMYKEYIIDN